MTIAFRQSRYESSGRLMQRPEGDYLNCPFTKKSTTTFIEALVAAERIELRDFEREDAKFFEGCLPIEVLAKRGHDALAFGPMRPIGLRDPRTGKRPARRRAAAAGQSRRDAVQHRRLSDQPEVAGAKARVSLDSRPGERRVYALRHDASQHVHQFADCCCSPTMQFRTRADLFFAGQITGVEGYIGNAASGLVAGLNAARLLRNEDADRVSGDDDAGRVVSLRDTRRPERLSTDESQLRHSAAAGQFAARQARAVSGLQSTARMSEMRLRLGSLRVDSMARRRN